MLAEINETLLVDSCLEITVLVRKLSVLPSKVKHFKFSQGLVQTLDVLQRYLGLCKNTNILKLV